MKIPSHIAIIMDGNGRWARSKGLARHKGHQAGVQALTGVVRKAGELGVSSLTVYAFSTENWKRPGSEVSFLMSLFQQTLLRQARDLFENNTKVRVIGRRAQLSRGVLKAINQIEELTAKNEGLELNIAFNYGGRAEILDMVRRVVDDLAKGRQDINQLTEEDLQQYLYNPAIPEIELLIRTGGEQRLSNYLLWQSAYAELYFCEKYWPDFTGEDLIKAINSFQIRSRRFGGLEETGDQ
ncbi:MAG: polyprenyl diphosphate synthase [Halanaerobiales bacterium]|nr:polyprenyl diphosphate synthase [Halanaerobiales bacterium]